MCGIVGIALRNRPIQPCDKKSIYRVLEKMKHRGPDGKGVWGNKQILFGHRRLSIIDLSSAGAQPFVDTNSGVAITFNGEIYNYQHVRKTLLSKGGVFQSASDTEVILQAYNHYGTNFLEHLNGMFAFCIHDTKKNKILLARDPVGEKPLYYYHSSHLFVFASEIKAFHAFPEIELSIDSEAVKAFFSLQYIPGSNSIYKNIKKVPAGSLLELDLHNWRLDKKTYWSIEKKITSPLSSLEEIDYLLSESVKSRLVADVEVGLMLSGGIDSSLLASYAHRVDSNLRVFTANFDDELLDEEKYARQVANYFGLRQIVVNGGQLTPEIFKEMIYYGDEPLGDPANIPTFLLSGEISEHVKVILSGEGADELFWGYDTYRFERIWRWFSWVKKSFSNNAKFQKVIGISETSNKIPSSLTRLGKLLSSRCDLGVSRWTSVFADHTLDQLIIAKDDRNLDIYFHEMEQKITQLEQYMHAFDASLSSDLIYWLVDDLLVKVDRMTMAHSIEARTPYLDKSLIFRTLSLPNELKLGRKTGKLALRKLLEKHIPENMGKELAWRKKHGFEVPVDKWLNDNLRELVEEYLSPTQLAKSGLLNVSFAENIIKNYFSSSKLRNTSLRRKIWLLLCFQVWYEQHENGFGFY